MANYKINSLPAPWPYVSYEQQRESFTIMASANNQTVWEFEESMRVLLKADYISKSQLYRFIKLYRKIKKVSYTEYAAKRNRTPLSQYQQKALGGLWT